MNVREVMNRAVALFPKLNVEEIESEAQRRRVILDFYYYYLSEFCVDVENLNIIQINQPEISIGNDMISTINYKCSAEALIPNYHLGLFDLITPSPNVLWSKIHLALDFYDYSDEVMTKIFELCNPFMESKVKIKEHEQTKIIKKKQIMELKLKINHTKELMEEVNTHILDSDNLIEETAVERRLLEIKIQQAIARRTVLTRKKNQIACSVEEIKNKLSRRKNVLLDHSVNCDSKISKLEEDLNQVIVEKELFIAKREEMKRDRNEIDKLKNVLAQRLSTTSNIFEVLTKYNDLKVHVKDGNTSLARGDIDVLNNEISNQIQETEKLSKNKNRELTAIENKLLNYNKFCDTKIKLEEMKKKFKDLQSVKIKLEGLDSKGKKISENYKLEVAKLKEKQEKLVNMRKKVLNENKHQLSTIEEMLKKINMSRRS